MILNTYLLQQNFVEQNNLSYPLEFDIIEFPLDKQ